MSPRNRKSPSPVADAWVMPHDDRGRDAQEFVAGDWVGARRRSFSAPPSRVPGASRRRRPHAQPRTPWGDPDLDGVWTSDNNFSVPLERPAEVSDKVLLDGEDLENALRARAKPIAAVADGGVVGRRAVALVREPDGALAPQLAHHRSARRTVAGAHGRARQRAARPRPRDVAAGRPTRGRISASGIAASPSACRA